MSEAACRLLAALLEARTGQKLGNGRRWRLEAVLQPLVRERGFASLDALAAAVVRGGEPALARAVVEALLNNETFFFRDRGAFELLLGPALSRIERARGGEKRIAIWCAGCSTGQEAYSIAMALAEQRLRWAGWRIEIVGTDVSEAAIAQARSGLYSQFEVQRGLGVLQMMRWFSEEKGAGWRLSPAIRDMVRFETRSLAEPTPEPGAFDIVLCRNVMLYFAAEMRRATFDRLAGATAADGVLMLGAGETVIGQTDAFVSDPDCRGLYVRAAAEPLRRTAGT